MHRTTKDCDILHPSLPEPLVVAARQFANLQRNRGEQLADDWLNNGPQSLADLLPGVWQERLIPAFTGQAIELRTLGRLDLLRSKIFSLCDRALDLQDCIALAPIASELREIESWLSEQDGNPEWPHHVRAVLDDRGRRLGYVL